MGKNAKWHLLPNLHPSTVLNLLHMRVLIAEGVEPLGTGGGATMILAGRATSFKFIMWATTL